MGGGVAVGWRDDGRGQATCTIDNPRRRFREGRIIWVQRMVVMLDGGVVVVSERRWRRVGFG